MHPDIEMAMLTGYPTIDYTEYERQNTDVKSLDKPKYSDANDFFEELFVKEGPDNGCS